MAALTSFAALSQTPSTTAPLPSSPGAAGQSAGANTPQQMPLNLNAKVAGINIEAAVFLTNEGQRDLE